MSNTLLKKVRTTYDQGGVGETARKNVGPTADNSSRIALLKKIQVKTNYWDKTVSKTKYAQLWGLNNLSAKGNKTGSGGDSGIRTKFVGIFPRMNF